MTPKLLRRPTQRVTALTADTPTKFRPAVFVSDAAARRIHVDVPLPTSLWPIRRHVDGADITLTVHWPPQAAHRTGAGCDTLVDAFARTLQTEGLTPTVSVAIAGRLADALMDYLTEAETP